eukprot:scaffold6821_cov127-Cylindrotheca_fusiformis.AAC.10
MQLRKNPGIHRTTASSGKRYSLAKVCLLFCCGAAGFMLSAFDVSTIPLNSMATTIKGDDAYRVAKTKNPESEGNHSTELEEGSKSSGTGVRQISILGERNSGTRWTFGHVGECFNHSIKVTTTFTRYKHWFQFNDPKRYKHKTLVIAQFRNPYTWLKAMQKVPHHSPAHLEYRRDKHWKKFLSTKWTMERIGTDRWPNQTEPCQQFFEWKDIRSCQILPLPKESYREIKYSNDKPFYEMRNDGSGEPYDNIMEMRSDKIRNFLSVKNYEGVVDAWYLQYEHLVRHGTKQMIDNIAEITGVEPMCEPYPPQDRKTRTIDPEMAEFINTHLNWTVEAMIGYVKATP